MNVRVLAVLGVVAVVVLVLVFRGCEDERLKQIQASLDEMVAAVETADEELLEIYIAADYSDRLGHDQTGAIRRVMSEVEHYPAGVRVQLAHLDIDIEDHGYARVRFVPELVGDTDDDLKQTPKYDFQRGQRLLLKLRQHGTRWVVVKADMAYSMSGAL